MELKMSNFAVLKRLMVLVIHCNFSEYPIIICWLCSKWTLSCLHICSQPPRFLQKRAVWGQRDAVWVRSKTRRSKTSNLSWLDNERKQNNPTKQARNYSKNNQSQEFKLSVSHGSLALKCKHYTCILEKRSRNGMVELGIKATIFQ